MTVTITKEGDRLMGQPAGQPKVELLPESETKFYVRVVDAEVTFQRDQTGKVAQFTLSQGGLNIPAKRVEAFTPDSAALAEYAGAYYSDELGTVYTLIMKDGKLVAQHRRLDDIAMTPTAVDQFSGNAWWFAKINLVRDKENRIIGFKLTGGRVGNLRFDRQSH